MMVIHHGALPFLFFLCLRKGLSSRGATALWLGMSLWICFVFWGALPAQSFCPYSALKRETPSPMPSLPSLSLQDQYTQGGIQALEYRPVPMIS